VGVFMLVVHSGSGEGGDSAGTVCGGPRPARISRATANRTSVKRVSVQNRTHTEAPTKGRTHSANV
jgi:hypothetical protein